MAVFHGITERMTSETTRILYRACASLGPSPFSLIVRGWAGRLDCARSASWNAGAGVRKQLVTSRQPAKEHNIPYRNSYATLMMKFRAPRPVKPRTKAGGTVDACARNSVKCPENCSKHVVLRMRSKYPESIRCAQVALFVYSRALEHSTASRSRGMSVLTCKAIIRRPNP